MGDSNDPDSVGGSDSASPRFPTSVPSGPPRGPLQFLPGASSGFSGPATSGEPAGGWTGDEGGERCGGMLWLRYLQQYLLQS